VDSVSSQYAVSWDLIELTRAGLIGSETRGGAMPCV